LSGILQDDMNSGSKTILETLPLQKLNNVEVWTEKIDRDRYQISAKLTIPHSPQKVWQVITDYEALPDFIPNLVKSQRLIHPESGIRVEQIGFKCALHFCFSARVVVDFIEHFPHKIQFQMVEGDFKVFSGEWKLLPDRDRNENFSELHYSLQIAPKIPMPIAFLKKQLHQDLPVNLLAISQRVSEVFS
jgi:ribosome-associated toxin RatA of RatAB toxin-antitoxin module